MPLIRLRQYIADGNGQPAYRYAVYIGKAGTDPKQNANKLVVTDGIDGAATSNPFYVDKKGRFKNSNDVEINPYIVEQEYSYLIESPNGAPFEYEERMLFDTFGNSGGNSGGSTVDGVYNNFFAARAADLTDQNLIYIQSYAAGWEATAEGNLGDFYAYRTGNVGAVDSGNPGKFYDSTGAEFQPIPSQKLYIEMFGGQVGSGNDSYQALQDMVTAANDLGRECYADSDGEYLISNQSKTAPNYSLVTNYAIDVPSTLDLRLGENTTIKNATLNSGQFIFFSVDADKLSVTGGNLDGNASAANTTGALYIAGGSNVKLDTNVSNSAPVYLSASQLRQTGFVEGKLRASNALTYAVSLNSGGAEEVALELLDSDTCDNGVELTNSDIDGFGISLLKPKVSVQSITGTFNDDIVTVKEGAGGFFFDSCTASATNVFGLELGSTDVDYLKYNSLDYSAIPGNVVNYVSDGGASILEYQTDKRGFSNTEYYTSGSAVVWDIPQGITRFEVAEIGGGGQGGGNAGGGDGGDSTFAYSGDTLTAGGGSGGVGSASGGAGGSGGSPSGEDFGIDGYDGTDLAGEQVSLRAFFDFGYGIGANGEGSLGATGGGGGYGAYAVKTFAVNPLEASATYTVGSGGTGGGGQPADDGIGGLIIIRY